MKRYIKLAIGGAILVIVIVGVILAVVLKKRYEGRDPIMYFAIHIGDKARAHDLRRTQTSKLQEGDCGLELNKLNIRETILAMADVKRLYAFIFYSYTVNVTSPINSAEASRILDTVKSRAGSSYTQSSVAKEYINQRGKEDLLVYFIPCDFTYRKGDDDLGKFVAELKAAGVIDKVLVVSNTRPSRDVADLYELSGDNVVGEEHDIVGRISDFGHSIASTRSTHRPRPSTSGSTEDIMMQPPFYEAAFETGNCEHVLGKRIDFYVTYVHYNRMIAI